MWEKYKAWIIGAAVLLILGAAGYLLGGYYVDYRAGTDAVRASLQRIEAEQQRAAVRLGRIESGLDTSIEITSGISGRIGETVGAVGAAEERNDAGKVRLESSQRIIESGESILRGIRKRAEGDPAPAQK